ncbi:sugar-transfer associated ATP-grasp domain-containing protein [Phascolarctobacterium sp.]
MYYTGNFDEKFFPNFFRVDKAAKVLYSRLPQLGVIHWDLTLDVEDNVIVIEMNTYEGGIWLPQMAVCDNTAEILQWISK